MCRSINYKTWFSSKKSYKIIAQYRIRYIFFSVSIIYSNNMLCRPPLKYMKTKCVRDFFNKMIK